MKDLNQNDALGNPIIIGNKYGYAQNTSGVTTTVLGVVEKFTKTGATLKVISALRAYSSTKPEKVKYDRERVTVKCLILFPICK